LWALPFLVNSCCSGLAYLPSDAIEAGQPAAEQKQRPGSGTPTTSTIIFLMAVPKSSKPFTLAVKALVPPLTLLS
jgi:hypothetical protein